MILYKQTDLEVILFLKNEPLSFYLINIFILSSTAYKFFLFRHT